MAPVDGSGGLSAGAWLDLDLLRQRRERFGLERSKVIPVRELLWRGGLIGAVLPLVLLVVVLFLWCRIDIWLIARSVWSRSRQSTIAWTRP